MALFIRLAISQESNHLFLNLKEIDNAIDNLDHFGILSKGRNSFSTIQRVL